MVWFGDFAAVIIFLISTLWAQQQQFQFQLGGALEARLRGLGISWGAESIACGTSEAKLMGQLYGSAKDKISFFARKSSLSQKSIKQFCLFLKNNNRLLSWLFRKKSFLRSFLVKMCFINLASGVPQVILSVPQLIPKPLNLTPKAPQVKTKMAAALQPRHIFKNKRQRQYVLISIFIS